MSESSVKMVQQLSHVQHVWLRPKCPRNLPDADQKGLLLKWLLAMNLFCGIYRISRLLFGCSSSLLESVLSTTDNSHLWVYWFQSFVVEEWLSRWRVVQETALSSLGEQLSTFPDHCLGNLSRGIFAFRAALSPIIDCLDRPITLLLCCSRCVVNN